MPTRDARSIGRWAKLLRRTTTPRVPRFISRRQATTLASTLRHGEPRRRPAPRWLSSARQSCSRWASPAVRTRARAICSNSSARALWPMQGADSAAALLACAARTGGLLTDSSESPGDGAIPNRGALCQRLARDLRATAHLGVFLPRKAWLRTALMWAEAIVLLLRGPRLFGQVAHLV